MTLKIIHTSDWHLGQHFYGKSRAKEHQAFLSWLLEQVQEHDVDAVIVAGDIFDTGTPPSNAREMYFEFIVSMHKMGCQLIVLAGNHDSAAMLAESKSMAAHLSCRVISSVKQSEEEQVVSIHGHNGELKGVVCAVPYIRPKDIQVSQFGQSASDKQNDLRALIAEHYASTYKKAKASAESNNVPVIATGHLTAVGATLTESVRELYIGTLDAVPASDFPPADYIALGHIHRPQVVAKSTHIRYCGSPIPLSFDESTTKKQVNLVSFEDQTLTEVTPIYVPRFQPLAVVKTTLPTLIKDVETHLSSEDIVLLDDQVLWLDVEVSSADYLSDLNQKIEQLTDTLPVEVLRIRKSKTEKSDQRLFDEKLTLDELSVTDVFDAKLAASDFSDEQQIKRLRTLYLQTVEQFVHEQESEAIETGEPAMEEVVTQ